jgi:hypothetical protein
MKKLKDKQLQKIINLITEQQTLLGKLSALQLMNDLSHEENGKINYIHQSMVINNKILRELETEYLNLY